jgi:hypothetical protein
LFVMAALAGACKDGGGSGPTTFESDFPGSSGSTHAGATQDAAGLSPPTTPTSSGGTRAAKADSAAESGNAADADRAISEADVIQLDGDHLFALSRTAGLAVIDVSDPSSLKLIGRFRELSGSPFEMYLRGDVAILMFSGWSEYVEAEDGARRREPQ